MGMFDSVALHIPLPGHPVPSLWQTKDDLGPGGDQLADVVIHADRTVTYTAWEPPGFFFASGVKQTSVQRRFEGSECAALFPVNGTEEGIVVVVVFQGLVLGIEDVKGKLIWKPDGVDDDCDGKRNKGGGG